MSILYTYIGTNTNNCEIYGTLTVSRFMLTAGISGKGLNTGIPVYASTPLELLASVYNAYYTPSSYLQIWTNMENSFLTVNYNFRKYR